MRHNGILSELGKLLDKLVIVSEIHASFGRFYWEWWDATRLRLSREFHGDFWSLLCPFKGIWANFNFSQFSSIICSSTKDIFNRSQQKQVINQVDLWPLRHAHFISPNCSYLSSNFSSNVHESLIYKENVSSLLQVSEYMTNNLIRLIRKIHDKSTIFFLVQDKQIIYHSLICCFSLWTPVIGNLLGYFLRILLYCSLCSVLNFMAPLREFKKKTRGKNLN